MGTGKMLQWLSALATHPEDSGSNASTKMTDYNNLLPQSKGSTLEEARGREQW